jgi:hypothetical protein
MLEGEETADPREMLYRVAESITQMGNDVSWLTKCRIVEARPAHFRKQTLLNKDGSCT